MVWRTGDFTGSGASDRESTEAPREAQAAGLAEAGQHPYLGGDGCCRDERSGTREELRISAHFRGDIRNRFAYSQLAASIWNDTTTEDIT